MERVDISRLDKNRTIYLQLGFIAALLMTILAFNYTKYDYENPHAEITIMLNDEDDVAIISTPSNPARQLPPPVFKVTEDLVIETTELTKEVSPQLETTDLSKIIQQFKNRPAMHFVVDKALPLPPPPPADLTMEISDAPFIIVEKMPLFGDCATPQMTDADRKICSDRALVAYLAKEIRYPALARENNIEGTAVIQFIINEKGAVTEAEIVRNLAGGCGQEALRVIKNMPNWLPGQQRARKVKVKMTLPVRFYLQRS